MAAGAVAILALGRGLGRHAHHGVASILVCSIAASLYLLMAQGQGDMIVSNSQVAITPEGITQEGSAQFVYFARYIDWIVTTPLLLIGLLGIGLVAVNDSAEAARERSGLVVGVIGADMLMILTGLFGALSLDDGHKYTWFVVSCVFFVAVLAVIWGPVRKAAAAQGPATAALYGKLLGILTVLWLIYPVLWLLGTEGTGVISLDAEVAVFTVIDLLAKVGFGVVLVLGVKRLQSLEAADRPSPSAVPAAG
ncbi:MAG: bacteriorhodopsin [Solirubrobacteraceae bacterium]|nr:bacteriorhodopsin [Solirubrobacteraceae bacterium]